MRLRDLPLVAATISLRRAATHAPDRFPAAREHPWAATRGAGGRGPGFIAHTVLLTGDDALVSVSICEDEAGLMALDRLFAEWLAGQPAASAGQAPRVVSGEVILQTGL